MNADSSATLTELVLHKTALQHAANAIALCEAVRDDSGEIVDFRYIFVNQRYREMAAKPTVALGGQLATVLFPNALATGIWQRAADVCRTGSIHQQELFYTTQSGHKGWYDVKISHWDNRGVVISLMEVSEQKARSLAEQQQTELLAQIVSNSLNGILVVESMRNEQGQIVDFKFRLANKAVSMLNGYTPEYVTGSTFLTLFPAIKQLPFPSQPVGGNQTVFERYVEIIDTGEPVIYDIEYYHDGLAGWYWNAVSRLNDGLIITFLDVTALKTVQQQLERTVRELKYSNQNLEQFAYVASHDLQEPLRKITTFGDLLYQRLGDDGDEVVRDVTRRIQDSAQRMQGLVKDLLAYSRLNSRGETFDRVMLNQVLDEALHDLQPLIDEKQAIIEWPLLPSVEGDAPQLRQLLFCLLNNALVFHKADTVPHITITTSIAGKDELPLLLAESGFQFVTVSVRDEGIGFDEKYLDRIFTIFQRLHGRGNYKGNGIGLAIARKVAENHSGALIAHSQPNQGAIFTTFLPVR